MHSLGAPAAADKMPSASRLVSSAALRSVADVSSKLAPKPAGDPFNIVPAECERMAAPARVVVGAIAPNATVVIAWPHVLLSDGEIRGALDNVLGTGSGTGPAVLAGLSDIAKGLLVTTTSQTVPTAQQIQERAVTLAPTWLAGGFLADPQMSQSISRGYLWLAFRWPTAQSSLQVGRTAQRIVFHSVPEALIARLKYRTQGLVVLADDETDSALEDAARKSVLALTQGAIGVASALGFMTNVSLNARAVTSSFKAAGNAVEVAAQTMASAPGRIQAADLLAQQALGLSSAQAAQGQLMLLEAKKALETDKQRILAGLQAARPVFEWAQRESEVDGNLAMQIRNVLFADISSKVSKNTIPTVSREWQKCVYWQRAQQQLDRDLRTVRASMERAKDLAGALLTSTDSAMQLVAALDVAIANLDYALSQLPLGFLERDLWGAPTYLWLGGGALVLVGGALGIRAYRKRKARPTPNRRRRRSR